jgi:hypothetical protein
VDALVEQLADRNSARVALDSYGLKNPKDSQKVRLAKQNL